MYKVRVRMYIPVQGVANVCIFLYIRQQRVHHVCASGTRMHVIYVGGECGRGMWEGNIVWADEDPNGLV